LKTIKNLPWLFQDAIATSTGTSQIHSDSVEILGVVPNTKLTRTQFKTLEDDSLIAYKAWMSDIPVVSRFSVPVDLSDKPATMSSLYEGADVNLAGADKAIDGDANPVYSMNACTHTASEDTPWWQVDIQGSISVKSVEVFAGNSQNSSSGGVSPFSIYVGDDTQYLENTKCGGLYVVADGASKIVDCQGVKGRYVTVMMDNTKVLNKKANCSSNTIDVADKPTSQMSTRMAYPERTANKAIDGDLAQCTEVESMEENAWWRMDLVDTYWPRNVTLWGRNDTNNSGIQSVKVYAGMSPTYQQNNECIADNIFDSEAGDKEFLCNYVDARYIHVVQTSTSHRLSICEMQIDGCDVYSPIGVENAKSMRICEVNVTGSIPGEIPFPPRIAKSTADVTALVRLGQYAEGQTLRKAPGGERNVREIASTLNQNIKSGLFARLLQNQLESIGIDFKPINEEIKQAASNTSVHAHRELEDVLQVLSPDDPKYVWRLVKVGCSSVAPVINMIKLFSDRHCTKELRLDVGQVTGSTVETTGYSYSVQGAEANPMEAVQVSVSTAKPGWPMRYALDNDPTTAWKPSCNGANARRPFETCHDGDVWMKFHFSRPVSVQCAQADGMGVTEDGNGGKWDGGIILQSSKDGVKWAMEGQARPGTDFTMYDEKYPVVRNVSEAHCSSQEVNAIPTAKSLGGLNLQTYENNIAVTENGIHFNNGTIKNGPITIDTGTGDVATGGGNGLDKLVFTEKSVWFAEFKVHSYGTESTQGSLLVLGGNGTCGGLNFTMLGSQFWIEKQCGTETTKQVSLRQKEVILRPQPAIYKYSWQCRGAWLQPAGGGDHVLKYRAYCDDMWAKGPMWPNSPTYDDENACMADTSRANMTNWLQTHPRFLCPLERRNGVTIKVVQRYGKNYIYINDDELELESDVVFENPTGSIVVGNEYNLGGISDIKIGVDERLQAAAKLPKLKKYTCSDLACKKHWLSTATPTVDGYTCRWPAPTPAPTPRFLSVSTALSNVTKTSTAEGAQPSDFEAARATLMSTTLMISWGVEDYQTMGNVVADLAPDDSSAMYVAGHSLGTCPDIAGCMSSVQYLKEALMVPEDLVMAKEMLESNYLDQYDLAVVHTLGTKVKDLSTAESSMFYAAEEVGSCSDATDCATKIQTLLSTFATAGAAEGAAERSSSEVELFEELLD